MSTAALLGIAVGAVFVLLLLVIGVKMSAFVALILVSLGTALATGIAPQKIVGVLQGGMGDTLGSVMIVVGLGAILGRLIEMAGGADSLARAFTLRLGEHRVIAAVTASAFILGIPVFFDVGFIILAPIVFGFARVAGLNPLKIGLPVAGALLTVHVALPPHPGPVAAAGTTGADNGMMIMIGLPICAITVLGGYFIAKSIRTDGIQLSESPVSKAAELQAERAENDSSVEASGAQDGAATALRRAVRPIGAGTVILLILLPILQIMLGTVSTIALKEGTTTQRWLSLIGSSAVALTVAVIVAYLVVGRSQGWNLERRSSIMDSALPDVAVIVFVTGAGGMFAGVLTESGIGDALSETLIDLNMPIILAAYLISLVLRASQGSATVAINTSVGLMAVPIANAGFTGIETVLVTLAIGFGALGLSHINDSGFWIVTKYLGLSVKDGLKTWTVLSTVLSLIGFALTWAVFALVS
ncbi:MULTISPECIES: GntP family transporter [unclassified Actinobaculum]|uniref:GntP family transporter n=1 Tax=unclassified Actinobaculum TaxID=2609299 RepID=UPI000D5293D3|nr:MULTISPECIES: GntP family transporter [unclassified Actinobaculum]AWE43303.1 GntP family transporter [Actinobaculum sp. 313]RTE49800.1 GntP family transporter [Actinobaculum sp. 352]